MHACVYAHTLKISGLISTSSLDIVPSRYCSILAGWHNTCSNLVVSGVETTQNLAHKVPKQAVRGIGEADGYLKLHAWLFQATYHTLFCPASPQ